MIKRVKCINDRRPDLGGNAVDPYIRMGKFYTVVTELIPTPCGSGPEWIEIQCDITHEIYQRPRYMFGPILQ